MTVLDLTIIPTLISKGLAKTDDFDKKDYVIWGEKINSNLRYIPLLQDNDFMYKVDKVASHV